MCETNDQLMLQSYPHIAGVSEMGYNAEPRCMELHCMATRLCILYWMLLLLNIKGEMHGSQQLK